MDTKHQVTKKFIVGVVVIISSFVIAKLLLIPLFMFPGNATVKLWVIITYIFTWVMFVVGVALAGWEGYRLATHKYREYKKKTVDHVKKQSKKAAQNVKRHSRNAAKSVKKHTKKAAKRTKRVARKTSKATRKQVNKLKRDLHNSERQLKKAARKRHSL